VYREQGQERRHETRVEEGPVVHAHVHVVLEERRKVIERLQRLEHERRHAAATRSFERERVRIVVVVVVIIDIIVVLALVIIVVVVVVVVGSNAVTGIVHSISGARDQRRGASRLLLLRGHRAHAVLPRATHCITVEIGTTRVRSIDVVVLVVVVVVVEVLVLLVAAALIERAIVMVHRALGRRCCDRVVSAITTTTASNGITQARVPRRGSGLSVCQIVLEHGQQARDRQARRLGRWSGVAHEQGRVVDRLVFGDDTIVGAVGRRRGGGGGHQGGGLAASTEPEGGHEQQQQTTRTTMVVMLQRQ